MGVMAGFVFVCAVQAQQASDLEAFHRSGQTFITWTEVGSSSGESYRIYRHTAQIVTANLNQATMLADIVEGSSYWPDGATHPTHPIPYFIINDLDTPLPAGTGLFVNTPHESSSFYYCVTAVIGGVENMSDIDSENSLTAPIVEVNDDPLPVVSWESADGRGRQFIQYMDYSSWNPTFEGYAYTYWVGVPASYDFAGTEEYSLSVYMHGWGDRNDVGDVTPWGYETVYVTIDDPHQTWFYGFSSTYDFTLGGDPTSGPIANFTEERILRSVYDADRDPRYRVDENRMFCYGSSMGGSGALALGMRYPNVFAAIYAGLPMTNYQTSGDSGGVNWVPDVAAKWGSVANNLPIENRGPYATHLAAHDGIGVWDWQNHQANLSDRCGDETAFIGLFHGSNDDVIDWETQGNPVYDDFYTGRRLFSGAVYVVDHSWVGFGGLGPTVGQFDWQPFYGFTVKQDEAMPAFTYASGSSAAPPGTGPAEYNLNLEWAASWYTWSGSVAMVDSPFVYQVHVRSPDSPQTVDVTPRRLNVFSVIPGAYYLWERRDPATNAVLASGTVVADSDSLVTVEGLSVSAGNGDLLRIVPAEPLPVSDLAIGIIGTTAQLDWTTQPGMTYRIYHASNSYQSGSEEATGVLPPWTSGSLNLSAAHYYQVRADSGTELGDPSNEVGVYPYHF